jgi:threonine/homoserine/homoserine lactone efflux protein
MIGQLSLANLAPLVSLILMAAVVMGSPGPSTMSVTAVGAAFGWRRSLAYAAGLILGTTAVLVAVATGLFTVLLSVSHAAPILITCSALYVLYLAWQIATAPPLDDTQVATAAPSFWAGLLLAVANPKAYVAIAAVFAGTTLAASPTRDVLSKLLVLTLMIVLIHLAWLTAGASFATVLRDPVRSRIANIVFALGLVASVVLPLLR